MTVHVVVAVEPCDGTMFGQRVNNGPALSGGWCDVSTWLVPLIILLSVWHLMLKASSLPAYVLCQRNYTRSVLSLQGDMTAELSNTI